MDRLIDEFVSEMLDDLPTEALNRLVESSGSVSDEDLAFLSNQELEMLKRAHCDDIEAGRPDDGVYHRALFCRIRAKKQQAGASLDAATEEATIEATHIIAELTKNMELEGRRGKREHQAAPSAPRNDVPDPEAILRVYAFVNQQWQDRRFKLYHWTQEGKAEEIDPMGRRIGWFEKPHPYDIDFVTDKPYIKKDGQDWLRAAVAEFVRQTSGGKPGPAPKKRKAAKSKMLADLHSGRRTLEELKADTLEALSKEYGVSKNTAKLAREDALSEFQDP